MKRVLVYGSTMFLSGLLAQLLQIPGLEVQSRETLATIGDLTAFDVVLVDLNDTHSTDLITLLRARPDLRVVGVNAATSAMTVLAGQVYLAQTVEEVIACLTQTG